MTTLPAELIFIICQYLEPKDMYALAWVSKRFKTFDADQPDVLWKNFLNPMVQSGYKNTFFKNPFARILEQMVFKIDDPDYRFYLTKLEETIRPFTNNIMDIIKAKAPVLELVKTNCIYAGLVLYHTDVRIKSMINSVFLRNLVLFHSEAIDYILSHPNPEIFKSVKFYLLKDMVEKDPNCLEKIIKHPELSLDPDDLAQLTKLGGDSGLGGCLSAM